MNDVRTRLFACVVTILVACGDDAGKPAVDASGVDAAMEPLRSEGPPEVVAVFALSRIDELEAPIFCRFVGDARDAYAPADCPARASDFVAADVDPRVPTTPGKTWGLRVVLDERLDAAAVSTGGVLRPGLVHLTCGAGHADVPVTGTYTEAGDHTTSPPGPSITIDPDPATLVFPTGTACELTLAAGIVDETGTPVPADQRTYPFRIADLELIVIDAGINGASTTNLAGSATHVLAFNASLDDASVDASDFQIVDAAGAPVATVQHRFDDDWNVDADPDVIELNDGAYVRASPYVTPGTYTVGLAPGATIAEIHGGTLVADGEDLRETFTVAYSFISSVPATGAGVPIGDPPAVPPSRPPHPAAADLSIRLNGAPFAPSVTAVDLTLTDAASNPVPFTVSVGSAADADRIIVNPTADLTPGMTYTMTLPVGASFQWSGTCDVGAAPECKTLTQTTARAIQFRVQ